MITNKEVPTKYIDLKTQIRSNHGTDWNSRQENLFYNFNNQGKFCMTNASTDFFKLEKLTTIKLFQSI